MLNPMNTHFSEALNYKSYHLVTQYPEYNRHILRKFANPMDVQMRSAVFK